MTTSRPWSLSCGHSRNSARSPSENLGWQCSQRDAAATESRFGIGTLRLSLLSLQVLVPYERPDPRYHLHNPPLLVDKKLAQPDRIGDCRRQPVFLPAPLPSRFTGTLCQPVHRRVDLPGRARFSRDRTGIDGSGYSAVAPPVCQKRRGNSGTPNRPVTHPRPSAHGRIPFLCRRVSSGLGRRDLPHLSLYRVGPVLRTGVP